MKEHDIGGGVVGGGGRGGEWIHMRRSCGQGPYPT